MKYSKTLAARIGELVASDSYTIPELCKIVGISPSTYHEWNKKPDFSEAIRLKKLEFEELIIVEAKRSLMRKVKGYTATDTKTIISPSKVSGSPDTVKERIITEKHIAPDTVSVIFLLTNKAPEEFRNRQSVESKIDIESKIGLLSDSQLDNVINQVLLKQPPDDK